MLLAVPEDIKIQIPCRNVGIIHILYLVQLPRYSSPCCHGSPQTSVFSHIISSTLQVSTTHAWNHAGIVFKNTPARISTPRKPMFADCEGPDKLVTVHRRSHVSCSSPRSVGTNHSTQTDCTSYRRCMLPTVSLRSGREHGIFSVAICDS